MSWGNVVAGGAALLGGALASNAAGDAADAQSAGSAAAIGEQRRQFDLTRGDYAPYRLAGYGALAALMRAYGIPGFAGQTPETADQIRARLSKQFAGNGIDESGPQADAQEALDRQRIEDRVQEELRNQQSLGYGTGATGGQTFSHLPTGAEVLQEPGYAFGLSEGQKGLDRKFSAAGGRLSGASLKAASRFNTDYASTKYGEAYQRRQDALNRLAAIAGLGQTATSGSAMAGQNSANAISGFLSNQGDNAGAARLAQGSIWGNTANQLGAMYMRQQRPSNPGFSYGTPTDDWSGQGYY